MARSAGVCEYRVISNARFPIGGKNARLSRYFLLLTSPSPGIDFHVRASGISARESLIKIYLRRASIDFHSNSVGTWFKRNVADAMIAVI